jgi:6-phosphofructokinase 1
MGLRVGVLTSGGDSPGMNAAVRTATLAGIARGHTVLGIRDGFDGLISGNAPELDLQGVDGISRMGGTLLGTARNAVFPTPEGQVLAKKQIAALKLDALVVVGGSGSLAGAHLLGKDKPCRVVGVPASIDNDIGHCGMAIGVDTAVNTIVDACDRISDTARAHRRAFIVEVMGRHCGFLAMRAGLASEADAILFAEHKTSEDELVDRCRTVLRRVFEKGHSRRALIVKAEGVPISAARLRDRLQEHLKVDAPGVDIRETVLGHVVRGGNPSALDRLIAQRLGYAAMLAAEAGAHDVMLSWDPPGGFGQATADRNVRVVPLKDVLEETARYLDGTSPVMAGRVQLLKTVEDMMSL